MECPRVPHPLATAALVALLALAWPPAKPGAQVFDMGVLTNTLSMDAVAQHERRRAAAQPQQRAARPAAASAGLLGAAMSGPPPAAGSEPRLTYRPTPELARRAGTDLVGRLRGTNPEAARVLERQLAGVDHNAVWRRLVGTSGLRGDDAVDAVAAYMILGWLVANGVTNAPDDPAGAQAVRRQLAGPLAANPALADPATRAAVGEEMKLLFVVLHAGWQAAGREGTLSAYAAGVARMFERFGGQDPRRVALTSAGFRLR